MKNLILASTSTVHGSGPLEYLLETLESHFRDASDILFIPFARPGGVTHESYTEKVRLAFQPIGKNLKFIFTSGNKKALTHILLFFLLATSLIQGNISISPD